MNWTSRVRDLVGCLGLMKPIEPLHGALQEYVASFPSPPPSWQISVLCQRKLTLAVEILTLVFIKFILVEILLNTAKTIFILDIAKYIITLGLFNITKAKYILASTILVSAPAPQCKFPTDMKPVDKGN